MKKLFDVLGAIAFCGVQAFYLLEAFERHQSRKKREEEERSYFQEQKIRNSLLFDVAASLSAQLSTEQRKVKEDILKESEAS